MNQWSNAIKPLSGKRVKSLNPWIIGILIGGALGTASTIYLKIRSPSSTQDLVNQTVIVQSQDLTVQIQASGVVQPVRKINLSPEEAGRIAELHVQEGDRVEPGQIIARMDSEQLQAQVNQYQALQMRAQADLSLKRAGDRPEEITETRARVATAEASVAAAQASLMPANEELTRNQPLVQAGAISRNAFTAYVAKAEEARANLDAEQRRLAEQQASLQKSLNGTRPEEIAQAEAELAEANAQLNFYQTQFNKTTIQAPFAGVITRRFAEEGDFVTPTTSASESEGATSTSIVELSSGLEIEAKIPEANIAQISLGQSVDIQTDAYPNETFKGQVRLIAPRAIQQNQVTSFRVKVSLQTGQETLKPGMNVRLSFLSQPIQNALAIPLAAVVTQPDGQTGVYLSNDPAQSHFQSVQLGISSGNQVQVLEGLTEGDRIRLAPPSGVIIEGVDTTTF